MICSNCGYMQADDQIPCRRCGTVNAQSPSRAGAGSVLDFPRQAGRMPGGRPSLEVHTGQAVPAWRAELSARVRQLKARRSMEAELEAAMQEHQKATAPPVETAPVITVTVEPEEPPVVAESLEIIEIEAAEEEKPVENPLVRAALNRVKRASENNRVAEPPPPPRVESPRVRTLRSSAPVMTTATAPVLREDPRATPTVRLKPESVPTPGIDAVPSVETVESPKFEAEISPSPRTEAVAVPMTEDFSDLLREVRDGVSAFTDRPEIVERLRAGAVDAATIFLSNMPLWAAVALVGGQFTDTRVKVILLTAGVVISGLYLFGTVAVSGQTFGMMYAGFQVVGLRTGERPTFWQAFLRTVGYLLSCVTLMIGFVWAIFDKDQRGLHEHLSGTQVVRLSPANLEF